MGRWSLSLAKQQSGRKKQICGDVCKRTQKANPRYKTIQSEASIIQPPQHAIFWSGAKKRRQQPVYVAYDSLNAPRNGLDSNLHSLSASSAPISIQLSFRYQFDLGLDGEGGATPRPAL